MVRYSEKTKNNNLAWEIKISFSQNKGGSHEIISGTEIFINQ
jgi:hypothetical protein